MVHRARAVGKCQNQVPYSCAIGMWPELCLPGLSCAQHQGARQRTRKEATSSAGSAQVPGSPTVRRRELGALLRALRNERGLTVDQVAAELLCSPSKVSRMETGQRGATLRDIRDLCDLYGVTDAAERERLMTLAREGKQQGWWQSYRARLFRDLRRPRAGGDLDEDLPLRQWFPDCCRRLGTPGRCTRPICRRFEPEIIEQRVEERLTRQQQVLDRAEPPRLRSSWTRRCCTGRWAAQPLSASSWAESPKQPHERK